MYRGKKRGSFGSCTLLQLIGLFSQPRADPSFCASQYPCFVSSYPCTRYFAYCRESNCGTPFVLQQLEQPRPTKSRLGPFLTSSRLKRRTMRTSRGEEPGQTQNPATKWENGTGGVRASYAKIQRAEKKHTHIFPRNETLKAAINRAVPYDSTY